MKRTIVLIAGTLAALGGCSDPKEANKENFKTAIDAWISKNPPCIAVPRGQVSSTEQGDAEFPRYIDASPVTGKYALESRERQEAPFLALVDAGLMARKDVTVRVKAGLLGDARKDIPVHAYDLTEVGRKAVVSEGEKTAFSSPAQRFCYGAPVVDEIVQFTEPADAMGVKMSQVSYRYHLKDLPEWAGNARLRAAFPDLARNTAQSLDAKAVVVLTNEGWVHEKASALR